jgi:teichuronic acid biosynthesis glycosyltransferase TuaG
MNEGVSVIIPTYNRSAMLGQAIGSVLKQTHPVDEIIICDDGSTDNSFDVVKSFNEERITWINCGKNGRPAIPRNTGIKNSTGKWLAFLDDDDEWLPSKIERQLNYLKDNKGKIIATNGIRRSSDQPDKVYTSFNLPVIDFKILLASNYILCSSVLAEKKLVEQSGKFPEEDSLKALEDYVLWLKIAAGYDILFLNEELVVYNDDSSKSIRAKSDETWQQRQRIFDYLLAWFAERNISKADFELLKEEKIKSDGNAGLINRLWRKYKAIKF